MSEATSAPDSALDRETIYSVLNNQRRRVAVDVLSARGELEPAELAEAIGERVTPDHVDASSGDVYKRHYVSLYQTHLDALANAGVVEWTGTEDSVTPTERCHDLAALDEAVGTLQWVADGSDC